MEEEQQLQQQQQTQQTLQNQATQPYDLLILYGSETGNAHYLAEEIERDAITKNLKCYVSACDDYEIQNLPNEKLVIFVVSTTGQGDAPQNMLKFWSFCLIKDLPKDSLKNIKFSVFGLGDSNYQLFNAMARKLNRRLIQLGAEPFVERGLGDDQHPQGYYHAFDKWNTELYQALAQFFPNNELLQKSIQDNEMVNEDQQKQNQIESISKPISKFNVKFLDSTPELEQKVLQNYKIQHTSVGVDSPYQPCPVINKELLTPEEYERKTYKIDFDITNTQLKYKPGDILVVQPTNDPKTALDLANLLKLEMTQFIEITINPLHPSKFKNPYPKYIRIYDLFVSWLDISSYPNRYFLKLLSLYAQDPLHIEKLQEMSAPNLEGQEEFYEYIVKERRNIYEIFFDFSSIQNFPLEYLLESVQLLKPRKYSISSSQDKIKNQISLTIGLVKYKTEFNRQITGICSRYLENINLNQRVLLQVQKGVLPFPKDLTTPVIMVGPGTGLAPFMSFIEDRVQIIENMILQNQKPDNLNLKTVLFYGCRYKSKDFYYKEQLESLHEISMISLFTAFSRDQNSKNYVQHQIEKNQNFIFNLIQQNFDTVKIFVCGTSKFMPQQVEDAFVNAIKVGNKQNDEAQAKEIINYLKKKKQYVVEAW